MPINNIDECLRVPIIATISYNPDFSLGHYGGRNTRCYVNPKLGSRNGFFDEIDSALFPTQGSIEVQLNDDNDAGDFIKGIWTAGCHLY